MKRFESLGLWMVALLGAMALGMAGAPVAQADVTVTGTVQKFKTKTVTENITITKNVKIDVQITPVADAAAESQVVNNQSNTFVFLHDLNDEGSTTTAEIANAGGDGSGILYINQSPGNINNQANEASIAAATNTLGTFVHSEVAVEQINTGNVANETNQTKKTTINFSSLTGSDGVIGINQASNDMNNQKNALSAALSFDGVAALGEVDLGQFNTNNTALEFDAVNRTDEILGGGTSPDTGVFQFNQASGPLNNQANAVNIAIGSNVVTLP
jgi:hypothetical protein